MKATFAGRSARRRMRYGYHWVPNGTYTRTPEAGAAQVLLQVAPDAVQHLELEPVGGDALRLHEPARTCAISAGSCVATAG